MFDAYGQYQASSVVSSCARQRYDPSERAIGKAASVFQSVLWRAELKWAWGELTRRPHRLLDLDDVRRGETIESVHETGCVTVEIRKIRGSECRVADFDDGFLPLKQATRQRWASIYAAHVCGHPLPAVSLVQVGDTYYVRDGHHRISVARLLGEEFMEAHVQVWQVKGQVASAPAMSTQMLAYF